MTSITFLVFCLFCVVFLLCCENYRRRLRRIRLINRIPGPPGDPIIGNLLESFRLPPNQRIGEARKYFSTYGPIVRFWMGPMPFIGVAGAEIAEIILTSNVHIGKGIIYKFFEPWLGNGLLLSTGGRWRVRRKILTPTFHFQILESFVDVFYKNSQILVDRLANELNTEKFDIFPYLSECTLDIICETAMGVEMNVQNGSSKEYIDAVHTITKTIADRTMNVLHYPQFIYRFSKNYKLEIEALEVLHKMSSKVIEQRILEREERKKTFLTDNKTKRATFLDLLLDVADKHGDELTLVDIREEVDTFMFEGHDTTSAGLVWTIHLVGCHPEVQDKITAELNDIFGSSDRPPTMKDLTEMQYLETVFKESMRLYPPVPVIGRNLETDIEFGEYVVPKGTPFLLHIHALHRSPKYYENPNQFDPSNFSIEKVRERNPFAYVPFSGGPRNCIGQKFAMLEEKVILSSFFRKYRVTSTQTEENVSVLPDTILRPEHGVWIKIEKRL